MSAQNASHLNNNTSDQCSDNWDGRSNASIGSGSLGVPRGTIRVSQPFCPQMCFDVMAKAYRNGEVGRRRGERFGVILTVDACWGSDVRWRRCDRRPYDVRAAYNHSDGDLLMTVSMSRWLYQQILLAAAMLKHFILSLLAFPSTPFSPSHLLAFKPAFFIRCMSECVPST